MRINTLSIRPDGQRSLRRHRAAMLVVASIVAAAVLGGAAVNANNFVLAPQSVTPTWEGDAAWGDFDGDGDLDLAICGQTNGGGWITETYDNQGGTLILHQALTGVESVGRYADALEVLARSSMLERVP